MDQKLCPLNHLPCKENKCAWWNEHLECCAIAAIPDISDVLMGIDEAKNK